MTASEAALNGLKQQRPEWQPWLAVVQEILRDTGVGDWEAVPTRVTTQRPAVPLLAEATITVRASSVRRLMERLIQVASRSGTPTLETLASLFDGEVDVMRLFEACVCQNSDHINEIAAARGVDAGALQSVMALVPLPLLHACHRRWASSIAESWVEGYCPVCGAWPAFAEVRGIERSRCYRCGRCGVAWHARLLHCPYCALHDHDQLVSLVSENDGARGVIEACKGCLGYVKTFTRLQGCSADTVMLEDLASVDLDIAALEHGYSRPAGAGSPVGITLIDSGAARSLFAWKS